MSLFDFGHLLDWGRSPVLGAIRGLAESFGIRPKRPESRQVRRAKERGRRKVMNPKRLISSIAGRRGTPWEHRKPGLKRWGHRRQYLPGSAGRAG